MVGSRGGAWAREFTLGRSRCRLVRSVRAHRRAAAGCTSRRRSGREGAGRRGTAPESRAAAAQDARSHGRRLAAADTRGGARDRRERAALRGRPRRARLEQGLSHRAPSERTWLLPPRTYVTSASRAISTERDSLVPFGQAHTVGSHAPPSLPRRVRPRPRHRDRLAPRKKDRQLRQRRAVTVRQRVGRGRRVVANALRGRLA